MPSLLGKTDPIALTPRQFANWKYELINHMDKSLQKFTSDANFSLVMVRMLSMDKHDKLIPNYKIMLGTIKNYIEQLTKLEQD